MSDSDYPDNQPEFKKGSHGSDEDIRNEYFNDPKFRQSLRKKRKRVLFGLFSVLSISAFSLFGFLFFLIYLSFTLPSLEQLENPKPQLATEVYSADGVLLTKFFLKNRTLIKFQDIAPSVTHALLATEDIDFYNHWGFNTERSITRKLRELITSVLIERTYTKNEILSLYLNTVYFGQGAYGIEAASWTYFSKPAKELLVQESALLIGLLKSPTHYDPITKEKESLERRNLILNLMQKQGYITFPQKDSALATPIALQFTPVTDAGIAPYFTEYIRQQLEREAQKENFNIYEDGLIVQTTLDTRMQAHAENAIKKQLTFLQNEFNKTFSWHWANAELRNTLLKETSFFKARLESGKTETEVFNFILKRKKLTDSLLKEKLVVQSSFIAIDPETGHIKAWVGGKDFSKYKFDRVSLAKRQPGSTFKPFVYLTALNEGVPPNFMLLNQPLAIKTEQKMWIPKNSDEGDQGGETTLRDALKRSLNNVTIRLSMNYAQPSKIEKLAKAAGIETPLTLDLAMALGASVVSPLELATSYATFANNGTYIKPTAIVSIRDRFENEITSYSQHPQNRIDPAVNFILLSMLRDVIDDGTGREIRSTYNFKYDAAGKTGTTQGQADAWFAGCTPQLAAVAWCGFDDNRIKFTSMYYGQGSKAALPIWAMFMKDTYNDQSIGLKPTFFKRPTNGIYKIFISKKSNNPTIPGIEDGFFEYFTSKMVEKDNDLSSYLEKVLQQTNSSSIPNIKPFLEQSSGNKRDAAF
ncbi:hypothetical protein CHS0354_023847 [Potamilus streckersoni]|uniref:peptidoglycan glycosyltransferase n=1 Tax=Potamilus streckersoni TaxID=2493646 RepID=A0AAE0RYY8_9BIVA|nr:hypothetical protein CHS0354_023847 [Potamilus streckersoni]